MTVLDLSKSTTSGGGSGPTIVTAAAAAPNPVSGKSTSLSVSASDPAGASSLTYTWMTTGAPPAPVDFNANGTNSAQTTTATFSKAGTYHIQVAVTDPTSQMATSSVRVTVIQALTSITVVPALPAVLAGSTDQFTASAFDQFGNPLAAQPTFTWSVVSGGGSIGATSGLYAATTTSRSATIRAAAQGFAASADVTITPIPNRPAHVFVHYAQSGRPKAAVRGTFTIINLGSVPVHGWVLQFTLMPGILSISGATMSAARRGRYTVKNLSVNAWITPGGSVSFVIRRAPARNLPLPSKLVFNGVPVL
jgi:hypothetical protein